MLIAHDSSIYSGTLRFASIFQINHARRAQNLFAIVYVRMSMEGSWELYSYKMFLSSLDKERHNFIYIGLRKMNSK